MPFFILIKFFLHYVTGSCPILLWNVMSLFEVLHDIHAWNHQTFRKKTFKLMHVQWMSECAPSFREENSFLIWLFFLFLFGVTKLGNKGWVIHKRKCWIELDVLNIHVLVLWYVLFSIYIKVNGQVFKIHFYSH